MVEPPNKGHIGDSINSVVLSFIERLSSFRGSQCTKNIDRGFNYYTVSLLQRVHYWRFQCIWSGSDQ